MASISRSPFKKNFSCGVGHIVDQTLARRIGERLQDNMQLSRQNVKPILIPITRLIPEHTSNNLKHVLIKVSPTHHQTWVCSALKLEVLTVRQPIKR